MNIRKDIFQIKKCKKLFFLSFAKKLDYARRSDMKGKGRKLKGNTQFFSVPTTFWDCSDMRKQRVRED